MTLGFLKPVRFLCILSARRQDYGSVRCRCTACRASTVRMAMSSFATVWVPRFNFYFLNGVGFTSQSLRDTNPAFSEKRGYSTENVFRLCESPVLPATPGNTVFRSCVKINSRKSYSFYISIFFIRNDYCYAF